ncbi:MAG TPA: hypothetical protein VEX11_18310, partial [Acetobacteraceae bacterium]|nr:hypothetical protein [Acetobacteraceae bacterium]
MRVLLPGFRAGVTPRAAARHDRARAAAALDARRLPGPGLPRERASGGGRGMRVAVTRAYQ